jgi:hypothetical protein
MHRLGCFVPIYSFLGFALLYTFLDATAGRFLWLAWPAALLFIPIGFTLGLLIGSDVFPNDHWQVQTSWLFFRRTWTPYWYPAIFIPFLVIMLNAAIINSARNGGSPDRTILETDKDGLIVARQMSDLEYYHSRTPALRRIILMYSGIFAAAGLYFWYVERFTEEDREAERL